jgi:hypothetical protein
MSGCKEKKQHNDIITKKVETPKPQGPIRMQDYTQTKDVQWLGKSYQVEVKRIADDSLKMVKDETGQQFVDNRISLRVCRADGSVFFSSSFTKAAFESHLDADYRRTGILEGFVFDKVEGNHLFFAASVCHPETDEYIPLVVTVNNMGEVGIRLDDSLDTYGDNSISAEDDDI